MLLGVEKVKEGVITWNKTVFSKFKTNIWIMSKVISFLKNDFLNAEIRLIGNGTDINNGLDSCDFLDILRSVFSFQS